MVRMLEGHSERNQREEVNNHFGPNALGTNVFLQDFLLGILKRTLFFPPQVCSNPWEQCITIAYSHLELTDTN